MKKGDFIFYFMLAAFFAYIFLFFLLLENLPFWFYDFMVCYKQMSMGDFLLNHTHIIFYIFSFVVIVFYLIKGFLNTLKTALYHIKLRKLLEKAKVKTFKSIMVVDFSSPMVLNIGFFKRYIVLSKGIFYLDREDRKYIFLHEKSHFLSKDSIKFAVFSIICGFLPFSKKIKDTFLLIKEIEADKSFIKDKYRYIELLAKLSLDKRSNLFPNIMGHARERILFLLEDKEISLPVNIFYPATFFILIIAVYLFRICFCGVM